MAKTEEADAQADYEETVKDAAKKREACAPGCTYTVYNRILYLYNLIYTYIGIT